MSYQRFYKFGAKSRTNIQRLIDGTDFAETELNDGDGVFNTTHEMGMAFSDNPSGNAGVFMSGDMMQVLPDTSGTTKFGQRWIANDSGSISALSLGCVEGPTSSSYWENAIGVSFNTSPSTGDYWAIQHTGIATLKWGVSATANLRNLIEGSSVEGQGADAGSSGSGTFGHIVNTVNVSSGFCEALIGVTETL
jgi:hypothetical protein